ncbi:CGNR zinc finger domain-containing protein [Glycomyces sp. NPDC046736]|uniref:CGNR zinc finger domain-containing protein n=1 Tax=Glycomyces sp. NPDC046736 TaxID=3155615 RepID=UPI0033E46317
MKIDTLGEFTFHAGRPWLDFIATQADLHATQPLERLSDTSRLAEWLRRGMGAEPEVKVTEADLDLARWARDALQALADSAIAGTAPPIAAVAAANRAIEPYTPPRAWVDEGRLRHSGPHSVETAMSWLALEAVLMLSGDDARQLRRCAADDCGDVFADPSGRRRWCPGDRCGVKQRVRAHRERNRETGS